MLSCLQDNHQSQPHQDTYTNNQMHGMHTYMSIHAHTSGHSPNWIHIQEWAHTHLGTDTHILLSNFTDYLNSSTTTTILVENNEVIIGRK